MTDKEALDLAVNCCVKMHTAISKVRLRAVIETDDERMMVTSLFGAQSEALGILKALSADGKCSLQFKEP